MTELPYTLTAKEQKVRETCSALFILTSPEIMLAHSSAIAAFHLRVGFIC